MTSITSSTQILEWHISVDGAEEKGHPISRIEMNFGMAAKCFDMLAEKHSDKTVRLFAVSKNEIKKSRPRLTAQT